MFGGSAFQISVYYVLGSDPRKQGLSKTWLKFDNWCGCRAYTTMQSVLYFGVDSKQSHFSTICFISFKKFWRSYINNENLRLKLMKRAKKKFKFNPNLAKTSIFLFLITGWNAQRILIEIKMYFTRNEGETGFMAMRKEWNFTEISERDRWEEIVARCGYAKRRCFVLKHLILELWNKLWACTG